MNIMSNLDYVPGTNWIVYLYYDLMKQYNLEHEIPSWVTKAMTPPGANLPDYEI